MSVERFTEISNKSYDFWWQHAVESEAVASSAVAEKPRDAAHYWDMSLGIEIVKK